MVKLSIQNLVPVGYAEKLRTLELASGLGLSEMRSSKGNLNFERLERKLMQAVYFFKGSPPQGAKDTTIFNRETFQTLNQRSVFSFLSNVFNGVIYFARK